MPLQFRGEYPRPQFERELWLNLNGDWEFEFDDKNMGEKQKWFITKNHYSKTINVPFSFQSKLSGIEDRTFHNVVWYRKKFCLPVSFDNKRVILHFGAVDYLTKVWINGEYVTIHEGGSTPFKIDITFNLVPGENDIVVRVEDFSEDTTLPRGKQYWKEKSESIYYTNTTGIWQTVWLEAVNYTYIDKVKFTPDIDSNEIQIKTFIEGYNKALNTSLEVKIKYNEDIILENTFEIHNSEETRKIKLYNENSNDDNYIKSLWSPESPNLYYVEFTLLIEGITVDKVNSYFGMRKISIENGVVCLNNRPYYMRLVLDQGYYPDGILTPPSDEAMKQDVELVKAMGFNGVRKHQKVEDPRYLFWCDHLGLLVWGEMANAIQYSEDYVRRFTQEWQKVIERDYNHPCIVVWVPINESWGVSDIKSNVQQQGHALCMYYLTKSMDDTRPVISNDGWEHIKSDIFTIHDYESKQEVLEARYSTREKAINAKPTSKCLFVGDFQYKGEPINISEFGGIAFKKSDWDGWGYSAAESNEDFLNKVQAVVKALYSSPAIQGFCYTQFTDVEQEINGLLTYDRKPKVPLDKIKRIIENKKT